MNKLFLVIQIIILPFFIQSQTISEKLLYRLDELKEDNTYLLKCDVRTNSFVYSFRDTSKQLKNSILSNKGNSRNYSYIDVSNAVFDSDGNYYIVAEEKKSESSSQDFFLKNGKEIFSYNNIQSEITEKNGKLYLICEEKKKSFLVIYDISTCNIFNGKEYDELEPCFFEKNKHERVIFGDLGFTDDGEVFYLAKQNGESFLVIGEEEQMHYADINIYSIIQDKSGKFAFIAKEKNNAFLSKTNEFVVYGEKRYKSFDVIFDLFIDSKGQVIYTAEDFDNSFHFPSRIMQGDTPISKTYDGGIYNLGLTQDDKCFFVACSIKINSEEYEYFVVFDGKECKPYNAIVDLNVLPGDELLYMFRYSEDKYGVVWGKREICIEDKFQSYSVELMKNNKLAYISVRYDKIGNDIEDFYFVNFMEKRSDTLIKTLGPYDRMEKLNYKTSSYILSDKNGNYAYLVIKKDKRIYHQLHTNNGSSELFDNIYNISLFNGKVLYIARKDIDKKNDKSIYGIYYNNFPITPFYDCICDFKFDEKTGLATYFITRDKEIFKVEIKF